MKKFVLLFFIASSAAAQSTLESARRATCSAA